MTMGGDIDLKTLNEGPGLVKVHLLRKKPDVRGIGKITKGRTRENQVVPPLMN